MGEAPSNKGVAVRRTELTTPAHSMKMMLGAARSAADEVMLDLEDACAVSQKVAARGTLVEAATTLDWGNKILAFRPNNLQSPFFLDDMLEVIGGAGRHLDVLILPKATGPQDVAYVDQLLGHLEAKFSLPLGRIGLEVLIESAAALLRVDVVARASPRLQALIFGVADYAGDVGAALGADTFTDFLYAKQKTVAAARAVGLDAIDCVTLRYRDLEQTCADAGAARRMGFDGKWAIHPGQVEVINQAFTPTREEIARARRIMEAYAEADREKGLGAIVIDDEMVDRATIRVEEKKIAVARRAGLHV